MKALAAVLLGLVGVATSLPVDDTVDLSLSKLSCERDTLSCWDDGSTIIACSEVNTWTPKTRCLCKRGCWISENIHQDQAGLLVGKQASCICPEDPVNPKLLAHDETPSMDINTREEHIQQDYRMCCERGNCVMQCLGDPPFCQVIQYCGKNKDGTYGKDGCCKNGKCSCKTARADSGSEPLLDSYSPHLVPASRDVPSRRSVPEEKKLTETFACSEDNSGVWHCLGDPAFCYFSERCENNTCEVTGDGPRCAVKRMASVNSEREAIDSPMEIRNEAPASPASILMNRPINCEPEQYICRVNGDSQWVIMVCTSQRTWTLSAKCGGQCCDEALDHSRAFCLPCRPPTNGTEISAPRNNALAPRSDFTKDVEAIPDEGCEPGQYYCAEARHGTSVIVVCTSEYTLTMSADCGSGCCEASQDHSRAFCKPCARLRRSGILAPMNDKKNALTRRSDSTNEIAQSPERDCTPGWYDCTIVPDRGAELFVCNSAGHWVLSAECGDSCCAAALDHSTAFCAACKDGANKFEITAPTNKVSSSLTRRFASTKDVRQDPNKDCNPGTLWCADSYVLVCDSGRHLVISADCGSDCCRDTADHSKAFCQPCFKDPARKSEIAATTTEDNVLARRTTSTEDTKPKECEPRTYRCRRNPWARHQIEVCNHQSLWVKSKDCGAHNCCQKSQDHSRAFCKPCTSGPVSENDGLEDLATQNDRQGLEGWCKPGHYYCSKSLIFICNSDQELVISAYCGNDGICMEEPDNSRAFCKPASQSRGIEAVAKEHSRPSSVISRDKFGRCEPGKYYCRNSDEIYVCTSDFQYVLKVQCAEDAICVEDSDHPGPYCKKVSRSRGIEAEINEYSRPSSLTSRDATADCEPGKYYCRSMRYEPGNILYSWIVVCTIQHKLVYSADCREGDCHEEDNNAKAFCGPQ
ncbi:hypothetical protein BCR34DRAFT_578023 [Clohesyomyces aquaticus]|uniref:Uncharacterized protein n=1 Tax=Clohesyomyces aquaticus TaxID=1231657 RepID=A0A1Y1YI16_9PLEO|nr:hypothetical protein BCR34DRAFT_578023 [Clohesyomyces aquaticus]